MLPLIPLFAVFTPFLLWLIELILPYPYIVEEIALLLLLLPILQETRKNQLKTAVIIGLLFSISEGVLYLFNIILVGDIKTFLVRIMFTTPLHVLTPLIMLSSSFVNKRLIIVGFIIAVAVHYFFNLAVASYR